jgi:hypothetical protein
MVCFADCLIFSIVNVLGVDNKKYDGQKASAEAIASIAKSKDLEDSADIEAIFDKNRPAIQHQFKSVCVVLIRWLLIAPLQELWKQYQEDSQVLF